MDSCESGSVSGNDTEESADDLAALKEENAALRAEHELLLAETAEYGLMLELPNEPTSPLCAEAVSKSLQSAERQRKVLLGVRRRADELEELSKKNAQLRGEAGMLREENLRLTQQNAVLRASRANTPACTRPPSAAAVQPHEGKVKQQFVVVKPGVEPNAVTGQPVLPPGLEKRAAEISTAIKLGDQDSLNRCSDAQRKELVAAMLKVGLFDAAVPTSASPAPETPPVLERRVEERGPPAKRTPDSPPGVADTPPVATALPAVKAAAPGQAVQARAGERIARQSTRENVVIEKRAQEIAEKLKTCSDSERKELVAEMLREGLFGGAALGPTPPSSGDRGDSKAAARREPPPRKSSSPQRSAAPDTDRNFSSEDAGKLEETYDEDSRERVLREKLQELHLKRL